MQLILRFLAGGILVSLFAVFGDALKPRSFAGLFAAAPSIALATLALTIVADGRLFATREARSMIAGSLALFLYSCLTARLMIRHRLHALSASAVALTVWFGVAVGGWLLLLR